MLALITSIERILGSKHKKQYGHMTVVLSETSTTVNLSFKLAQNSSYFFM